MKMTKLLGAVLGVVLVATLFVGAGAATSDDDLGSVYTYVLYKALGPNGEVPLALGSDNLNWESSDGKSSISFIPDPRNDSLFYLPGGITGKYHKTIGNTKYIIHITYPSVQISGTIYSKDGIPTANVIDNTVGTDEFVVFNDIPDLPGTKVTPELSFTNPAGTLTSINALGIRQKGIIPGHPDLWAYKMDKVDLGEWKVRALFKAGEGKEGGISSIAPSYFYGDKYSFNVISSDTSKTITCNVDNVTQGGYATVKLTAPTGYWEVAVDLAGGEIPLGQPNVDYLGVVGDKTHWLVYVGTAGSQTFVVESTSTEDIKVTLYKEGGLFPSLAEVLKEITIKVRAGLINAELEDKSVYIGDEFDIKGTNDLNGNLYFYITGTNYPLQIITDDGTIPLTASGKSWTATIDTSRLKSVNNKSPDAGTYTIYIAKLMKGHDPEEIHSTDDFDNSNLVAAYTALSVPLVQPFIKASAPDVVVQGDKLQVTGTAEGKPTSVRLYVFGTNFYKAADLSVMDDGTFDWSKKILSPNSVDITTQQGDWPMAPGQYFAVVQHPMYDKFFNIQSQDRLDSEHEHHHPDVRQNYEMGADIVLYKTKDSVGQTLFNTADRQSANAAQALIDAMSQQDIDDMQAHFSFVVAGPTSYVNAIPSKITKGQTLTISGTTTGHKNDVVSVELLSTAFAAVPKETVGSASYSTLTTRIGENGIWSISFDTSQMNADDYTVSIAVGQLDATTAKVQIVDGPVPTTTPTSGPQPTSSGQPTVAPTSQPTTTPQTPGFGALAALVGLGAVAVLLLRRE